MKLSVHVVNRTIKFVIRMMFDMQDAELARVPQQGPLILAVNHVNSMDAPMGLSHLYPRPVAAIAKVETWDNPLFRILFNVWDGIPIRRGEADLSAIRLAQEALAAGKIVAVAPEGTRSRHGCLQEGHPGIVLLAVRSGAPILPVVYYGHADYKEQLLHFRRPRVQIVVGQPFYLDAGGKALSRDVRDQMTAEIMYQMAALLPPHFRGHYADMKQATQSYLRFGPQAALQF